jgi:toxin ParE1/3/4
MPRVQRSRQAEEDLIAIAQYIARDNLSAAIRWLDAIEEKLSLLASRPLMGEAVDHIRPGLRRASHGKYLIFFEPRDDGIALVRVLHGARRIEELL